MKHETPDWFDEYLEREDINFYDFIWSFNRLYDLRLNRNEFWELYWDGELDVMLQPIDLLLTS